MPNDLIPDEILSREFEYIAQTATQAQEDRARVTTFYLVAAGTFVAAILGVQFEDIARSFITIAFVALFVVLSLMGLLTLLQLIRLRQAWFESVRAMNQMKDYYVKRQPDLADAFRWRTATIPVKYKPWSVAYLLALQVAVLSTGTLAAAVLFMGLYFGHLWWWQSALAGVLFLVVQMWLHRRMLSG